MLKARHELQAEAHASLGRAVKPAAPEKAEPQAATENAPQAEYGETAALPKRVKKRKGE
jgi:hypothetical protein